MPVSKRAKKVRQGAEFDIARLKASLETPKTGRIPLTSWTLPEIFAARDAQLRGDFVMPARLAEIMRTDDALAVAYEGRLAPQRCIQVEMCPAPGARGAPIAAEAAALYGQGGVGITPETMGSIHGCLVDHDVAFGYCVATPRPDGSRVDVEMHAWPIEYVRWDPYYRCFKTRVDPETLGKGDAPDASDPEVQKTYGAVGEWEVPIVHGDGRWVIFQRFEIDPFKHATLLAAALVWARHAYGLRDWAKASVAHGSAKVIGHLGEGVPLQDTATAGLSAEASAMVAALRAIATSDSPVALLPSGATVDFLTNSSTAWQVWTELIANAEKAAARIYLGTDGTLGSVGGAPGVDIQALFGVAETKVEADLKCLEHGIKTGVIEPWCAMNFGDSGLAPTRKYLIPDGDAAALDKSLAERTAGFSAALKGRFDAGIALTQADVEGLAADFKVRAPVLPVAPVVAAPVAPAALSVVR